MINRAWGVNCETSYILALFICFFSFSYQTSAATPQTQPWQRLVNSTNAGASNVTPVQVSFSFLISDP